MFTTENETIDITSEQLILPTEVSGILPGAKGKELAVSTVYRWMQNGLRGVRLEFVCIGGHRYTSKEALNRFFTKVTAATVSTSYRKRNGSSK